MEDVSAIDEKMLNNMPEEVLEELNCILLNTQEQCQMMEQMIKNQIQVKDGLINKLHDELEYYKQDSASKFVNQLMKAVIKVRTDMKRRIESEGWESTDPETLRKEYRYTFEDLSDLLEQQNVDEYVSSPGEVFDLGKHQAKIEQTDKPELDKTVKKSISPGYTKGDKVLITERVVVYQYKEQ